MAGHGSSAYSDDGDGALMSDINVTPLVDVVLVLLIVFMITVPAIVGTTAPINVDLPVSSAIAVGPARTTVEISLRREASGGIGLFVNDQPTTDAELEDFFAQPDRQPLDQQPVSVRADRGIPYGEVTNVLDRLASLGIKKVSLQTRHAAR